MVYSTTVQDNLNNNIFFARNIMKGLNDLHFFRSVFTIFCYLYICMDGQIYNTKATNV